MLQSLSETHVVRIGQANIKRDRGTMEVTMKRNYSSLSFRNCFFKFKAHRLQFPVFNLLSVRTYHMARYKGRFF